MQRDARALLHDILQAADDIAAFTDMSLAAYLANKPFRLAVERQFTVIGEALNALSRLHPKLTERIPELPRLIAFRNVLVHRYETIDQSTVYDHARNSLPAFRATIATLLAELDHA